MMEEMNFEELRNQFAILKNQLNKQEIVSDRLLRQTMMMKSGGIGSTKRMVYVCTAFCLLIYPYAFYMQMLSLGFATATCLLVMFCAVATWYIHKPVERLNFMRDDFTTVARTMARFKKQYEDWLHYVAPAVLVPWLAWACYEFAWKNAPEGINPLWLCIPLIVGGGIGAIVGLHFHNKAVNAAQDILDEIND